METIKLQKKGLREIKIKPEHIQAGHVLDAKGKPTGRLIPNRVVELEKGFAQRLIARYPYDFNDLSAPVVETSAPALPKKGPYKGAPLSEKVAPKPVVKTPVVPATPAPSVPVVSVPANTVPPAESDKPTVPENAQGDASLGGTSTPNANQDSPANDGGGDHPNGDIS